MVKVQQTNAAENALPKKRINGKQTQQNTSNGEGTKTNKRKKGQQKKRNRKEVASVNDLSLIDVRRALLNCPDGDELKALSHVLQPESNFLYAQYRKVHQDLANILQPRFENQFTINPFGSTVSGLAFKGESHCTMLLFKKSYVITFSFCFFFFQTVILIC